MQLRRARSAMLHVMLVVGIRPLCAASKYWIAGHSDLVVVGRLIDVTEKQSAGGWKLDGKILPSELLFGSAPGRSLDFRFTCSCCPASRRHVMEVSRRDGLWFLVRQDGAHWTSAGDCSDPGYRPIKDRGEILQYFKTLGADAPGRPSR